MKLTDMSVRLSSVLLLALALAFAGLLIGCDGGDDSSNPPPADNSGDSTNTDTNTDTNPDSGFGDNNPDVVVAMGDSITSGEELPNKPPYPSYLESMTGKQVINEGVGGVTSDYGVGIVDNVLRNYKPGYILIMYGVNDIHQGVGRSRTLDNLRTMIQAARDNHTIPILGTITPRYLGGNTWDDRHDTLADAIRGVADSENARLADVANEFGHDESLFIEDGMHPNDAGTRVIAMTFSEQL